MSGLITASLTPLPPLNSLLLPKLVQGSFLFASYDSVFVTSASGCFYGAKSNLLSWTPRWGNLMFWNYKSRRRRGRAITVKASLKESPYKVLGISPNATESDIKRAYRKLALKYHPDVNKEANAEQKFMRIKHAYNMLSNSESRRRYDSRSSPGFSYTTTERNGQSQSNEDESFYGFGDFFRDLQEDWNNGDDRKQGKPKSLWEELSEIGEEFVEFLEQELGISDSEAVESDTPKNKSNSGGSTDRKPSSGAEPSDYSSLEDNINEIEATLARLKKELGL